jgi:CBS domain-containing protein
MKASDVMTRKVVVVMAQASLEEAARLMVEHRVSGLPVVDEHGTVRGMITEGDLLRRAETGTAHRAGWMAALLALGRTTRDYVHAHARQVGEMIDGEVIAVTPETPLEQIVALMESRGVKRLPVLENAKLVGIVARADLVKALIKALPDPGKAPAATDAQIRGQFLHAVDAEPWAPRGAVDCSVKDGLIELHGVITDERLRPALRVMAQNIAGARGVRDHLVCIEPISAAVISEGSDNVMPAA